MFPMARNVMKLRGTTVCFFIVSLLLAALTASCGDSKSGKFKVFVSILPQKYFVERIGGDLVDVSVMVGPGYGPTTYEPLPSQMIALAKTNVYFRIGVPFEKSRMHTINDVNPDMVIIDLRKGIHMRRMETFSDIGENFASHRENTEEAPHPGENDHREDQHQHSAGYDPHIWLSPKLVKAQVQTIYQVLGELDPSNNERYRANLEAFVHELDQLSEDIALALKRLPTRKILVFHPALGYFADEFDLIQVPIEVEGKEPTPVHLAKIIDFARKENIRVIFAQSQFSTKSAMVVAKKIQGTVVLFDPLAENYCENLRSLAATIRESHGLVVGMP